MDSRTTAALIYTTLGLTAALILIVLPLVLRHHAMVMRYRERRLALDKGQPLPPELPTRSAPWSPRLYLLRGLVWLFTGLAVSLFFGGLWATTQRSLTYEERVFRARNMRESGIPDEQVQRFMNSTETRTEVPLGWALTGLIPMGVGAAYILFYRAEGRNMPTGG